MRARLRYKVDTSLATGTSPVIRMLAVATIGLVIGAGLTLWIGHVRVNGRSGGVEGFWASLMRTLDPGTMGSDSGWPFRVVSLAVTVGGIFIVSTLIGLLSAGIDQRLADLRRGRSTVLERGHLLVLGWSPKLFTFLAELEVAHDGATGCVVVLASNDKIELEESIRMTLPNLRNLRVVVRSGDSSDPQVLPICSPLAARAIVVLHDGNDGDAQTVRTVLALGALGLSPDVPVVTELSDSGRAEALKSASPLRLCTIVSHEWIARITAQVCRRPELASIYEELLDFEGVELYYRAVPEALVGTPVGEIVFGLRGAVLVGISTDGEATLAPDASTPLMAGDELIVIAETDRSFSLAAGSVHTHRDEALTLLDEDESAADVVGILGWSILGERVLDELDHYLPMGSHVDLIVGDKSGLEIEAPAHVFQRFELRVSDGDTTSPRLLHRLIDDPSLDRLMVLAERGHREAAEADARVMLTLLELRQMLCDRPEVRVVAELLDPRNIELIRAGGTEEFIVGERLISLLMAQLSENCQLMEVFDSLLATTGPEFSVVPASLVVPAGHPTTLASVAERLMRDGIYLVGVIDQGRARLDVDLAAPFDPATMQAFAVLRDL